MKYIITIILFVLTFAVIRNADSQWVQVNAPTGGYIKHFAVNSTGLFAATETGGVFLRDNGFLSQKWAPVNDGLASNHVYALVANADTLFAGTDSGVCRSIDNGKNWTAVSSQYNILSVNTLAVYGSTVLAGHDKDLYFSTDKGSNWTHALGKGLPNISVQYITIDGIFFYAAFSGMGVFSSTDNGANWVAINSGLTDKNIVTLSSRGSNVFVSTPSGVYHSANNGAAWILANNGISENATVNTFVLTDTVLYASTDCCIYRSLDSGKNWMALSSVYANSPQFFSFALSGPDLFVSTEQGMFRSSDNGVTWIRDGLTDDIIGNYLAFSDTSLFIGTRSGFFSSSDQGKSWDQHGLKDQGINCLLINDKTIFAGGGGGIFTSIDGGKSWVVTYTHSTEALLFKGSNLFAAAYFDGLLRSSDKGNTWVKSGLGSAFDIITDSTNIFAGTGSGVYLSSDDGLTWKPITIAPTTVSNFYSSVMIGNNFLVGSDVGVVSSTDGGKSWIQLNNGLTDLDVVSLAISGSHLFAATRAGIFHSTNNGQSWAGINKGLTDNTYMMSLVISGQFLFACVGSNAGNSTAGGIFRRPLSDFGINAVSTSSNNLKDAFSVYPNPAENILRIESSKKIGDVHCILFDQLGRSVLVRKNLDFSNENNIELDVSNISSGIYFLRIVSNGISYTNTVFIHK